MFDLGGSGLKSALFESSNLAGSSTLVQLEPSLVLGYCPRNAHPRDWLRASVASLDAEVANSVVRFGFSLSGIEKLGGWDLAPAIARSKIRQRGYGGPHDNFPLPAATRAELETATATMCGNGLCSGMGWDASHTWCRSDVTLLSVCPTLTSFNW